MGITHKFETACENEFVLYLDLLNSLCADVNSDLSKVVQSYVQQANYKAILSLDVKPLDYSNPIVYYQDKQIVDFIGKYPSWPISSNDDKDRAAIATFLQGESLCKRTNDLYFDHSSFYFGDSAKLLTNAKQIVWEMLGAKPDLRNGAISFGPGATPTLKREDGDAFTKFNDPICTLEAVPYIHDLLHDTNLMPILQPKALGNVIFTVDKNALTNRMCALEPTFNGLVQKALGVEIRLALRGKGILKKTAQFHHNEMARNSSLDNLGVTVDAKNASGTISIAIVHYLVPPLWFKALDACRSQNYVLNDKIYAYEQFSSMGNGFTFELETLIFYAIAKAACLMTGSSTHTNDLSVYGDDVIIPRTAYPLFLQGFAAAGFEVNTKKTFHDGPFRESCGADWFSGVPVTTTKLRDTVSPRTLTLLYNELVTKEDQYLFPMFFCKVSNLLEDLGHFNFGPPDYSDGHLIDPNWTYGTRFQTYMHDFVGAPLRKEDLERFTTLLDDHEKAMKRIRRLPFSKAKLKKFKKEQRKRYKAGYSRLKSETFYTGDASFNWFMLNRLGTLVEEPFKATRLQTAQWQLAVRAGESLSGNGIKAVQIRNFVLRLIQPAEFAGLKYEDSPGTFTKRSCILN